MRTAHLHYYSSLMDEVCCVLGVFDDHLVIVRACMHNWCAWLLVVRFIYLLTPWAVLWHVHGCRYLLLAI